MMEQSMVASNKYETVIISPRLDCQETVYSYVRDDKPITVVFRWPIAYLLFS